MADQDSEEARAASPSHPSQQNSPLLRLPAELRNKIYEYAFDTAIARPEAVNRPKVPFIAAVLGGLPGPNMIIAEAASGLTITCRQVRAETAAYVGKYVHLEWYEELNFAWIANKIGEDKARTIVSVWLDRKVAFPRMGDWAVARPDFRSLQYVEALRPEFGTAGSMEQVVQNMCGCKSVRAIWR